MSARQVTAALNLLVKTLKCDDVYMFNKVLEGSRHRPGDLQGKKEGTASCQGLQS